MKDKKQKEDVQFWIVAKSSHLGKAGSFIAGQTYQVKRSTLKAVNAEIDAQRKSLTKEQRHTIKNFQYDKTVAPWDAYRNPLVAKLEAAESELTSEQAQLDRRRTYQQSLLNKKRDAELFKTNTDAVLAKNPDDETCKLTVQKAAADLQSIEAEIGITAIIIKDQVQITDTLEKQVTDLRKNIAEQSDQASDDS